MSEVSVSCLNDWIIEYELITKVDTVDTLSAEVSAELTNTGTDAVDKGSLEPIVEVRVATNVDGGISGPLVVV